MKKEYETGYRIYILRLIKGYTREELSELVDITPKFLYEIEKGRKNFSVQTLIKLSNVLEVACDYILTGDEKFIKKENREFINEMFSITNKQ